MNVKSCGVYCAEEWQVHRQEIVWNRQPWRHRQHRRNHRNPSYERKGASKLVAPHPFQSFSTQRLAFHDFPICRFSPGSMGRVRNALGTVFNHPANAPRCHARRHLGPLRQISGERSNVPGDTELREFPINYQKRPFSSSS